MSIRNRSLRLGGVLTFVISIWLLCFVPQATAETLSYKSFTHAVKAEAVPIADAEGHLVRLTQREGAYIFQNGEFAWAKQVLYNDLIKGAGTIIVYSTLTFLDGSTIITHSQTKAVANPAGVQTGSTSTGEIIHGTGRFQGIKGTITASGKTLPPEKGEPAGKVVGEGTYTFTLPPK